jgi:hypothetical protein
MNDRIQVPANGGTALCFTPARSPLLQRKCACGGTPGMDGECEGCRKGRLSLQRGTARQGGPAVPGIVRDVLHSPGNPLDGRTQSSMRRRFGHDFGNVRVHTGARAAESARSIQARAYTVGSDVVFGAGMYAPNTTAGRRLLTHELTHVLQQAAFSGAHGRVQRAGGEGGAGDELETEAQRAEDAVENDVERAEPGEAPGEPMQSNPSCPVNAVFSHTVAGPQKANCQVPDGQHGASKLAHFRVTGLPGNQSATVTEKFTALEDPYSAIGLLVPNSYAVRNGEFDDCYILASKSPLPSDFVLKVEQNHLYNGEVISKNHITYTPNGISFRFCRRVKGKCAFTTVCRL